MPAHLVAQLTELGGRVSLTDLVRETTDVIERLCIEAALELTADNRASAAEMLGLSRQEHDALAPSERTARLATAREAMLAAGAHVVVESVADVPRLLSTLAGTP